MIDWQPIETAPKDGSDILTYDGYDVWKVYWDEEDEVWYHSNTAWNLADSPFHPPLKWLPISDLLKPLGYL